MADRLQCSEQVGDRPGYWTWHQCRRVAKFSTTQNGKPLTLCTQHAKWFRTNGFNEVIPLDGTGQA